MKNPMRFIDRFCNKHPNFGIPNLMKIIVKEYDDVYYVDVTNQTGTDHLTSADGIHPYSWGYKRWADAIQKPITKILKKYDIK